MFNVPGQMSGLPPARRNSTKPRHALAVAAIALAVVAAWSFGAAPVAQSVSSTSVSAMQSPVNLSRLSLNQVLTASQPTVRDWGRLAYDAADGYAVLFGGSDPTNLQSPEETWTFSHGIWTDITGRLNHSPDLWNPAGAAITYDPIDREVLLVGPSLSNITQEQTWAFRGGDWIQLHPQTEPTARWYAAFAYDVADREAVLYGGTLVASGNGSESWPSDTWVFSNGNWSLLNPSGPTGPYQTVQSMAYDPANNLTVLLSSSAVNGQVSTSVFQEGAWRHQFPGPPGPDGPLGSAGGMIYDPALGEIVDVNGCVSWSNQTTEVWMTTNGSTWTTGYIPGTLDQLCDQSTLTYDSADGYALMTSPGPDLNQTGQSEVTQTWKLDSTPVGPGPTLELSVSPSSPVEGQTVAITGMIFGGYGYIWHILTTTAPGCGSVSNATALSCLVASTGTYTATFTVEDQAGRIATSTTSFTIAGFPTTWVLWTAVGVGSALGAGIFVWSRQRRLDVSRR